MILEGEVTKVYVNEPGNTTSTEYIFVYAQVGNGLFGERHGGFTKKADVRDRQLLDDKELLPKGALVRNWRQWTAVADEENEGVATDLLVPEVKPEYVGANFLFRGIPNFSTIPRGSLIFFPERQDMAAVLLVEEENTPCETAGRGIEEGLSAEGKAFPEHTSSKYVKVAKARRGLAGSVFRDGFIHPGDRVKIQVYEPKLYVLLQGN